MMITTCLARRYLGKCIEFALCAYQRCIDTLMLTSTLHENLAHHHKGITCMIRSTRERKYIHLQPRYRYIYTITLHDHRLRTPNEVRRGTRTQELGSHDSSCGQQLTLLPFSATAVVDHWISCTRKPCKQAAGSHQKTIQRYWYCC